jgi:DnaK suppressor protein
MAKNRKGGSVQVFERILRTKLEELRKRVELQRASFSGEHDPDDEAALAVLSVERELAMANLDRDTRALSEVEAALRSIDNGSYGICARCQESISAARLHALTWTRLCLECASGGLRPTTAHRESSHRPLVALGPLHAPARARNRAK